MSSDFLLSAAQDSLNGLYSLICFVHRRVGIPISVRRMGWRGKGCSILWAEGFFETCECILVVYGLETSDFRQCIRRCRSNECIENGIIGLVGFKLSFSRLNALHRSACAAQ